MAAYLELDLSLVFKRAPDNRTFVWLWLHMYFYEKFNLSPNSCNGVEMINVIEEALRNNPDLLQAIPGLIDYYLLPDQEFSWITNDERQLNWLIPQIQYQSNWPPLETFPHLTGRDQAIAMLDSWNSTLSNKAFLVKTLRNNWQAYEANYKNLDWFRDKKEGLERCLCAEEWLNKYLPNNAFQRHIISNAEDLALYFDRANHPKHYAKLVIREIKKRWARKQFDKRSADKKQVNVLLPKTVIAQLDALKLKHGLKSAQIIEELLRMESKQGLYLSRD